MAHNKNHTLRFLLAQLRNISLEIVHENKQVTLSVHTQALFKEIKHMAEDVIIWIFGF